MLTKTLIKNAISKRPWDLANETLYDLCRKYPSHKDNKEIIAKVWIIGRTYAAAIERRKPSEEFKGADFYTEHVAPRIRNSNIDQWFSTLKDNTAVDHGSLERILAVHCNVTNLFEEISGLEKRSLASKYLHFHFPALFFIFDTRAVNAIRKFSSITSRVRRFGGVADNEYRKFCEKCLQVRDHIKKQYRKTLTPRQLDNLLLDLSNSKSGV